jgi:hypothetical protein
MIKTRPMHPSTLNHLPSLLPMHLTTLHHCQACCRGSRSHAMNEVQQPLPLTLVCMTCEMQKAPAVCFDLDDHAEAMSCTQRKHSHCQCTFELVTHT